VNCVDFGSVSHKIESFITVHFLPSSQALLPRLHLANRLVGFFKTTTHCLVPYCPKFETAELKDREAKKNSPDYLRESLKIAFIKKIAANIHGTVNFT